ncbi:MFS transporter [Pyrococcus abyssi]|uniref:Transport protein, permease n=1 Tax=Pyrococcus abyssi (strain GE5 / Orsay) TaxID=272844 RepID=Q9UZK0_PYRAB|nr:MFS transporter [Pyrococcus abyssi]CAB50057.1 Transport protein permease component, substrate unknown [Pyrococcus abyssi GE5]CCE70563.1 TPA: transport protein, permease [Pyrococcus abyssi GE5]
MEKLIILILISLGWIFNYSHRMAVPSLAPIIMKDLGINNAEIGLLMTSLLLPYSLIQVPAGYIGDKIGRKKLLTISILGYSLSSALIVLTRDYWDLVTVRALYGFFAGLYYAPATALISELFRERKGSALGFFMVGPAIGSGITPLIVVPVALTLSWRYAFLVLSIMSSIVGILLMVAIKGEPIKVEGVKFKIPRGVFLLSLANFLGLGAFFAMLTFLVSYLVSRGVGMEKASLMFSMLSLVGILGSIIAGFLYDHLGKVSVLLAYALNSLLTFLVIVIPSPLFLIPLGLVLYSVGGIMTAYTSEKASRENLGVVMGFVNMVGFFGATIGPYIVGFLIDRLGYSLALLSVPLAYLVSAVIIGLDLRKTSYKG